ncbi:MAG: hypothetical protein AB7K52_01895 [Phycisphaerales bacterium]
MYRKRGAPVFLELMADRARPVTVRPPQAPPPPPAPLFEGRGSSVAEVESKPVSVPPAPMSAQDIEERGTDLLGGSPRVWLYVAGAAVLAVVVWVVAYTSGKKAVMEDAERQKYELAAKYAGEGMTDPLDNPSPGVGAGPAAGVGERTNDARVPGVNGAAPAGTATRTVKAAEPVAATKIEAGYNYLVVATLMRGDAEAAAEYLGKNGLPIAFVSSGGRPIDPGAVDANNGPWMVVVVKGYTSAEFRRSDAEREALVTRVQSLGRTWKAENRRAPSDFSQVYWWKYKG